MSACLFVYSDFLRGFVKNDFHFGTEQLAMLAINNESCCEAHSHCLCLNAGDVW